MPACALLRRDTARICSICAYNEPEEVVMLAQTMRSTSSSPGPATKGACGPAMRNIVHPFGGTRQPQRPGDLLHLADGPLRGRAQRSLVAALHVHVTSAYSLGL